MRRAEAREGAPKAATKAALGAMVGGIPTASPFLTPAWIALLPPAVARAIGVAQAPAPQRAIFARTPAPVRVDLAVDVDGAGLPAAAAQLLKLMATSGAWLPGDVRRDSRGGAAIRCACGDRSLSLSGDELRAPIDALVRGLFADLFDGAALGGVIDGFARGAARLVALQILTQHMLEAGDVDEALFILLSGITAGDGLGLNRAAVFLHDEIKQRYVGARGVGPGDEGEAHRIWEAIELEGRSLDRVINGDLPPSDARFHGQVYGLEVIAGDDDEVAAAIQARRPILCSEPPKNPGLARLAGPAPFLLAAIQPRDRPIGLIFADNVYSGAPIDDDGIAAFAAVLGQTALVLDNLALLRHVERLARFDSLTGVLNRREFEARMKIEEARALRVRRPCAMLMVDLDGFKAINDSRGHAGGDAVLRQLGELLRESLRAPDLVGRFGGDEFVILLPEADGAGALTIAARIGKLAWEHEIALSIGGAAYPSDAEVPAGLFSIADRNLYAAKAAGRGRACVGVDRTMITLAGAAAASETSA